MELAEISLSGFKSFASPTRLRFQGGFTAIVGPNGVGKSNIADAVRWVLGEQSVKQLRTNATQDILYQGSEAKRSASQASVTLTLTNEDGKFPLPAAEVAISRVLTREGENAYYINGEIVGWHELQELLAQAGIGTKSYTVISQGVVDRYLMASPEGRRELFDEACGIKALQLQLTQARRRLERTERHAEELFTILRELQPRLRVLRRQVERQAEREVLLQELGVKRTAWLQQEWTKRNAARQALALQREETERQLVTVRSEREEAEGQLMSTALEPQELLLVQRKLAVAEEQYKQAEREWQQAQHHVQALTQSLEEVAAERRKAEARLKVRQQAAQPAEEWQKIRSLLQACQRLVEQMLQGEQVSQSLLDHLTREIPEHLDYLKPEAIESRRLGLERMVEPLAHVSRLAALEEERKQQLLQWQGVPAPDQTPVQKLVRQSESLRQKFQQAGMAHPEEMRARLQRSRAKEIELERTLALFQATSTEQAAALTGLEHEIEREAGSQFLRDIQSGTSSLEPTVAEHEIQTLEARLAQLGEVDELALREYKEAAERETYLTRQAADVKQAKENLVKMIETLDRRTEHDFEIGLKRIAEAFERSFRWLFGGGQAKLILTSLPEKDEALAETEAMASARAPKKRFGIDFMIHPPGKRPRHIQMLSGGEKSLTALALLLAILEVQSPPFVVLDEVDAALDETNARRFADMLQTKSQRTQCLVITHNRETMSQADVLYGVTMREGGISRMYSLQLAEVPRLSQNALQEKAAWQAS